MAAAPAETPGGGKEQRKLHPSGECEWLLRCASASAPMENLVDDIRVVVGGIIKAQNRDNLTSCTAHKRRSFAQ